MPAQIAQVARLFFYTNISKFYLEINLLNYIIFIIIVLFYHPTVWRGMCIHFHDKGKISCGEVWFYVFIENIITIFSLAVFFHYKIWSLQTHKLLHMLTTWLILICLLIFFHFCLHTNYGCFYIFISNIYLKYTQIWLFHFRSHVKTNG